MTGGDVYGQSVVDKIVSDVLGTSSVSDKTVSTGTLLPAQTVEESTSAVSTVKAEQLMKSSALNLRNSLFGNVLGLSAMQGSGPIWNEKASFSIRGLQSLSGSEVLILVDGFERPINDLTREEVESVSILKDAAAIALYGFKGINGVILVQTKRGKYKTMDIDISYDHGFSKMVRTPQFADASRYANAMNEAYINDGKKPRYNQFELDAFKNGDRPYLYPNVNWMDETLGETGHSNIYNISFRGGGSRMRYYTMFNLENNTGFFKNTGTNDGYSTQLEYSKANIRTNLDIDLTKSTSLEVNLLGVLAEYNHAKPDKVLNALYSVPSAAFPIKTEDGMWGGNTIWPAMNPVANLQSTGYDRSHARTLMADMKLTQKLDFITNGLNASIRFGYDNTSTFWEVRSKEYQYASDRLTFDGEIPLDIIRTVGGKTSDLSFGKSYGPIFYRYNFVGSLDYEKKFEKSKLFTTFIWNLYHGVSGGRHNTLNQQNFSLYTHYGLLEKYFIDLALVASGSNTLPVGNQYALSPTLSAAWVVSNENFLKDLSWLNLLKVRASAGIINSDYIPEFNLTSQQFNGGGSYFFGDNFISSGGTKEGRLPTTNFKTERALKYNLGIDASFFDSFMLTADAYFQRRDRIMVGTGGVNSSILGLASPYEPLGIVDSKGLEVGLNYDRSFGDLSVSAGGKFTLAKNKVVEKLEQPMAYDYLRTTGRSIGQPFALEAIGFFENEDDIHNSPVQLFSDVRPGDIKYKDQNKDGFVDGNDRIAMGYSMNVPEIYYSFNLGLEYKGFGIDALFQGVGRYSTWLMTKSVYKPLANNATISDHYYENRWTPENKQALYPRLTSEQNVNNDQNSSVWLGDASFLKLRHCEVFYKVPVKFISKAKMKSAKLYVRGMDLLSLDKMDVFDPEVVGILYPSDRSVHVGVSIGF